MAKHTNQPSVQLYEWEGFLISSGECFLYEISLNKYWKNGYCMLGSKFFKTDRLLPVKRYSISKKYSDYSIEKSITLLEAPQSFLNNLPKHETIHRSSKRQVRRLQR